MCEVSDFKKPVLREILTTGTPIRFPQKKRFLRKSDYRMTTRFFPKTNTHTHTHPPNHTHTYTHTQIFIHTCIESS